MVVGARAGGDSDRGQYMIVVGVDPGLANLGVGVIEGNARSARALYHTTLTTPSTWPMGQRLSFLYTELGKVLAEYQPQAAAMEDQLLRKQADVAFKVGQACGVVVLAFEEAGIPLSTYGPMEVKKTLVGTGRADKAQVTYMVRAQLGLTGLSNNHAADALAIALTHLAHVNISPLVQRAGKIRYS